MLIGAGTAPLANIARWRGWKIRKILCVENDPSKVEFLRRKQLKDGFESLIVLDQDVTAEEATLHRIREALKEERLHAVLIDSSCASAAGNNRQRKNKAAFEGDTPSARMLKAANKVAVELQVAQPEVPIVVSYEMILRMRKTDKRDFLRATSTTIKTMLGIVRTRHARRVKAKVRKPKVDVLIKPQVLRIVRAFGDSFFVLVGAAVGGPLFPSAPRPDARLERGGAVRELRHAADAVPARATASKLLGTRLPSANADEEGGADVLARTKSAL